MPTEPLLDLLLETELPWWMLWLTYTIFYVAFGVSICFASGGLDKVRDYFKDRLWIAWPLLVLGPSPAIYLVIHQQGIRLAEEFRALGVSDFTWGVSPSFWSSANIAIFIFVFIIDTLSQIRHCRIDPKRWFIYPWYVAAFVKLLFNVPLGYMLTQAGLRLEIQLRSIVLFLQSPTVDFSRHYFHPDGLFGLEGIGDGFFFVVMVLLLTSFIPMTMLLREMNQKHAWQYVATWITGISLGVIFVFYIKNTFDNRIEEIRDSALAQLGVVSLNEKPLDIQIRDLTQLVQLLVVRTLPKELEWPAGVRYLTALSGLFNLAGIYRAIGKNVSELPVIGSLLTRSASGSKEH